MSERPIILYTPRRSIQAFSKVRMINRADNERYIARRFYTLFRRETLAIIGYTLAQCVFALSTDESSHEIFVHLQRFYFAMVRALCHSFMAGNIFAVETCMLFPCASP